MTSPTVPVTHNPGSSRFEATVDGLLCRADYELDGTVMAMTHTVVPSALEGRGIAAALVAAAIAWARSQGYRVRPVCSYVQVYMKRHPEAQDLLAKP
ncbi:GNAT family N-acetyltransferase [Aquabacterium sp.]|uniref:GNAT family N-acetyltransferase n=1 Tax=Aquabacterium sp. TaxID=1872578 RepID=UPI0035AE5F96